ncbi:hypothetical protein QBC36DRAFT_325619 [Triangularia setosa]|uniref:DUF5672 domain-containing protein n=1 Tax=Triangularia setosa TaxID=2587417 RepID=A0AAN6WCL2_9PEZI|nr:hypothetical protein QBC36DRAFT_325619 [Podospora setosa]
MCSGYTRHPDQHGDDHVGCTSSLQSARPLDRVTSEPLNTICLWLLITPLHVFPLAVMASFLSRPGGSPRAELLLLVMVACMLLVTYSSLQSARSEEESVLESLTKVDVHQYVVVTTSSSSSISSITTVPTVADTPLPQPTPIQLDEDPLLAPNSSLDIETDRPLDATDNTPVALDTSEEDFSISSLNQAPASNKIFKAVLIETSLTSPSLIPIILHFSSVLPAHWSLVIFTSPNNFTLPHSVAFRNLLSSKRLDIRFLPKNVTLTNSASVSTFLASSYGWLWKELLDAERVLLFQLDSIICANSIATIDDFVKWDFVGAPINSSYGEGYNGGLSIRNPRLFLDVAKDGNYTKGFEDQWFYKKLNERRAVGDYRVRLPGVEEASRFAVETLWGDRPLGYHQPQRWWKGKAGERMGEIEEWCPEVGMLIGRRAK